MPNKRAAEKIGAQAVARRTAEGAAYLTSGVIGVETLLRG